MNSPTSAFDPSAPRSNDWLPPTWRDGLGYQDDPWTVDEVDAAVKRYQKQGYLTAQRKLTDKARNLDDNGALYRSIVDAAHNVNALRDAWNTPAKAWILLSKFLPAGHAFRVDPMHNPGVDGLYGLVRTLDGTEGQDGYAIDESREADVLARLRDRGLEPGDHEGFPKLWRGDLDIGYAAAAVNGPHSDTPVWLPLCDAYGQEEFCAAFVPYRGDRWLWDVGYRADIVVHFGRARCAPPPGIAESSPTGSSLGLLWVPPTWKTKSALKKLPEITRRVIAGEALKVPYHVTRTHTRHVLVTPGSVKGTIDLGMLDVEGRA